MSTPAVDRLYNLLPAVYRQRDAAQGESLRGLLALIEGQFDAVEQDIAGLYENWFIETCAEWVVPYIGDLLGVRPLYPVSPATFSQRAYVADTLGYRRRKGTAAMLEKLAADVTGWPACTVEFFQRLATTQYLNHIRPQNIITPDFRDTNALELLGGPFENAAHTVDVRHIASGRGRYNIPNIGIYLWRLADYRIGPIAADPKGRLDISKPARQGDAHAVAGPADGRYTFDPTGIEAPLLNSPQTNDGSTRIAEINVPGFLRRRPLYNELEALRQAKADQGPAPQPVYFGDNPILQVFLDGVQAPFEQMVICDIGDISSTDWRRPAPTKSYTPSDGSAAVDLPVAVAVDPIRGRIALPKGVVPKSVQVGYVYGFSGDVGAGPYNRTDWLSGETTAPGPLRNPTRWQVAVSQELPADGQRIFATLPEAVKAWNQLPAGSDGAIVFTDSRSYAVNSAIQIPEGSRLVLVAADWPALRVVGASTALDLDPNGFRPHVLGDIAVAGSAPDDASTPGSLYLDGVLLQGKLGVKKGNLGGLSLSHSTVVTDGGISVDANPALQVTFYRSICGAVVLDASVRGLSITDCIVSSGVASSVAAPAITATGAMMKIESATVFGRVHGRIVEASNSIFTGVVNADQRQTGCIRFCSLPSTSHTARRYRCQPDIALAAVNAAARPAVRARLTPQFTSTQFGQPAYAQLSARCAAELTTGAEDESEMGVFRYLQQPQRRANLRVALEEYLRYGLEAGSIEVT